MRNNLRSYLICVLLFTSNIGNTAVLNLTEEVELFNAVNQARLDNGKTTLTLDPILLEATRYHAEDMAGTGIVSYYLSNGDFYTENFISFGYDSGEITGALIGGGFSNAQSFVDALLADSAHRDVLLNNGDWSNFNWQGVGVGFAQGDGNVNYWAIGFGTSPVPIPAAAWLFGSALLALGAIKRRRA